MNKKSFIACEPSYTTDGIPKFCTPCLKNLRFLSIEKRLYNTEQTMHNLRLNMKANKTHRNSVKIMMKSVEELEERVNRLTAFSEDIVHQYGTSESQAADNSLPSKKKPKELSKYNGNQPEIFPDNINGQSNSQMMEKINQTLNHIEKWQEADKNESLSMASLKNSKITDRSAHILQDLQSFKRNNFKGVESSRLSKTADYNLSIKKKSTNRAKSMDNLLIGQNIRNTHQSESNRRQKEFNSLTTQPDFSADQEAPPKIETNNDSSVQNKPSDIVEFIENKSTTSRFNNDTKTSADDTEMQKQIQNKILGEADPMKPRLLKRWFWKENASLPIPKSYLKKQPPCWIIPPGSRMIEYYMYVPEKEALEDYDATFSSSIEQTFDNSLDTVTNKYPSLSDCSDILDSP